MTVQDAVRTVSVPRQAGPVDPPAPAPAPAAPLPGRQRPYTADEREFALMMLGVIAFLEAFIITGLLLAQYVWT